MEINQSPLSRFKSNKSNPSKTKPEARSISDAAKLRDTSHVSTSSVNQEIVRMGGKEGQVLKGEIIDLRYDGVSIQLEPSKQVITAKLDGDVPLSIGQNAQFIITEDASDRLTLKYIPYESTPPTDMTTMKALTASSLPLTQRNKAIVQELLNHRMSIDKQTLQTLIKSSHSNREASPLTLILMHKYHIPLTTANITQFDAYQKGTHQILHDIHTISKNFADLLHQPDTGLIKEAVTMNGQLLEIINNTETSDPTIKSLETPLSSLLKNEDIALLSKTLQQKMEIVTAIPQGLKTSLINQIDSGSMTLREVEFLITKLYGHEPETIQKALAEQASQQIVSPEQSDHSVAHIINNLINQFPKEENFNIEMKSVLTSQDRMALLDLMKTFPDIDLHKGSIADGSNTISDILNYVKDSLPLQEEGIARNLLESNQYLRLLEEAFHQKWTITPEKLAKKDSVTNLYHKLQDDLIKLNDLVKISKESMELIRFHEPIKNLQENLGFMKDLNGMFTYLQLPIHLKDQDVHSDFYVFTRKDALKEKKDSLSVLLHLNMQNLGPINIHIHMDHSIVRAKFYMEDATSEQVISMHLPLLTDTLKNKGYSLHAELSDAYEKPDFSKDFIDQSTKDNNIQRYTFDIRT